MFARSTARTSVRRYLAITVMVGSIAAGAAALPASAHPAAPVGAALAVPVTTLKFSSASTLWRIPTATISGLVAADIATRGASPATFVNGTNFSTITMPVGTSGTAFTKIMIDGSGVVVSGQIFHFGGIRFNLISHSNTNVSVVRPQVDLTTGLVTAYIGRVATAPTSFAQVTFTTRTMIIRGTTYVLKNMTIALSADGAAALNTDLGSTAFTAGLNLGSMTFTGVRA